VAPKAKVKAKGVVTPKNTAAPTGLHLSAAQRKAYNAAFTASAKAGFQKLALAQRRQAIANAAQQLRQSRLSANASIQKKAAAAHQAARTAAIAAFAAQQTYRQGKLAHQNGALQARLFADYERHIQVAARLQFIYKGEKAYAHEAVMRTLTIPAATSIEEALFARAAKISKKAVSTVGQPQSTSPAAVNARLAAQSIIANAKAAALAAARATPAGRTAPRPLALPYGPLPEWKAWFGTPDGYDCMAAAVANSCLRETGCRIDDEDYEAFAAELGRDAQVAVALASAKWEHPFSRPVRLRDYEHETGSLLPGAVIGFQTENGPHAALYLGSGLVSSWGEVLPLRDVMLGEAEEAWNLTWAV
jgi:hypothetical protein